MRLSTGVNICGKKRIILRITLALISWMYAAFSLFDNTNIEGIQKLGYFSKLTFKNRFTTFSKLTP